MMLSELHLFRNLNCIKVIRFGDNGTSPSKDKIFLHSRQIPTITVYVMFTTNITFGAQHGSKVYAKFHLQVMT